MRGLALLVCFCMSPGLTELLQDASHLLTAGHTVHDDSHSDHHGEPSPEHGCSGVQHRCSCHVTPSIDLAEVACLPELATAERVAVLWIRLGSGPDGVRSELERPPRG